MTDEGVADMSTVDSKSDLSENNVLSENGGNSNASSNWGKFSEFYLPTTYSYLFIVVAFIHFHNIWRKWKAIFV